MESVLSINSLGIDIGTTTTQFIFSRLTIANPNNSLIGNRQKLIGREVIHRSRVYFTPLLNTNNIHMAEVMRLLEKEFVIAGLTPKDIHSGAVIITGHSLQKHNAADLAETLAEVGGNFVVTTAGPHIEGIIAGRGSGAGDRSLKRGKIIANVDIGGGTTNIAVFEDGRAIDSCCLSIGGRVIKTGNQKENGQVLMIEMMTPEVMNYLHFLQEHEPSTNLFNLLQPKAKIESLTIGGLEIIADKLAKLIVGVIKNDDQPGLNYFLATENLRHDYQIDEISFSGGVADFIYEITKGQKDDKDLNIKDLNIKDLKYQDVFRFNDVGPLLGKALKSISNTNSFRKKVQIFQPVETIRATVTGAAIQTLRLSGNTVFVDEKLLPLKNIPVIKVVNLDQGDQVIDLVSHLCVESAPSAVALELEITETISFTKIQQMAGKIIQIYNQSLLIPRRQPLVIITHGDWALALGHTLKISAPESNIFCIDQIKVDDGDFIDIGVPLAGRSVPVVIKTLLFN